MSDAKYKKSQKRPPQQTSKRGSSSCRTNVCFKQAPQLPKPWAYRRKADPSERSAWGQATSVGNEKRGGGIAVSKAGAADHQTLTRQTKSTNSMAAGKTYQQNSDVSRMQLRRGLASRNCVLLRPSCSLIYLEDARYYECTPQQHGRAHPLSLIVQRQ